MRRGFMAALSLLSSDRALQQESDDNDDINNDPDDDVAVSSQAHPLTYTPTNQKLDHIVSLYNPSAEYFFNIFCF